MTGVESWKVLRKDFPKRVRESLLRGVIAAYPAAFEAASAYTSETSDWIRPLSRHAVLRDTLLAMERRFPGLKVAVNETDPPTTDYVTVTCGQSVLTIASVHSPGEMPRWAKHRESLAGVINYDLFDGTPTARKLYSLLYCGPEVTEGAIQHVPAFVGMGVPASDYGHYIWNHSLFDEFPGIVEEVTGVRPAEIRNALLVVRRRAAKGGAS